MAESELSQSTELRTKFFRVTGQVMAVVLSAFLVGIFIVWTELPRSTPLWCEAGHPSMNGLPETLDPDYIEIVDTSKLTAEVRSLYELALEGKLVGQSARRFREELLTARRATHHGHRSKTDSLALIIYEFVIDEAIVEGARADGLHHLLTLQIGVCQKCGTIQRAFFFDYRF